MSRLAALLSRLAHDIEGFYLTRARAVIDTRLRLHERNDCGLRNLRSAIDHLKTGKAPMASAPKPTMDALRALPGLIHKATLEANADAEALALRFAQIAARKEAAFTRTRDHAAKMEASIGAMEKFADDIEAVLGDNGGPKDLPTSEGSPAPSDPPPESGQGGDTRALGFSSLHPSLRSPMAEKVAG